MRGEINIPYLETRITTRKSGKTVVYWYWNPRKVDQQKFGVKRVRLAAGLPPSTAASEIRWTAIQEAIKLNIDLAKAKSPKTEVPAEERIGTLPWLFARWQGSSKWEKLAVSTRERTYGCWIPALKEWSYVNGHPDIRDLTKPIVYGFYEQLVEPDRDTGERPYATGKNVIATLRAALSFATFILDDMPSNPATKLQLSSAPLRESIWTEDQVNLAAKVAVNLGMPSVGLGIQISYALGQRRADIVDLRFEQWDGEAFNIRQQKTGAYIRIPATAALRRLMNSRFDHTKCDPKGYIITTNDGETAYSGDGFYDAFRKVTGAANLGDLWFHDLRRTAVVRMARAGLTLPQICAVTGHSYRTAQDIIRHYLPRDAEVAASAIRKLDESVEGKSLASDDASDL